MRYIFSVLQKNSAETALSPKHMKISSMFCPWAVYSTWSWIFFSQ